MKKTTVFLMLFLRVYLLAAQHEKVTLSGYVRDASSGEELLGASVLIKETDEGAVTNLYGFYSIHLLPGTYSLQFSYMGHETKSVEIVLDKNSNYSMELFPVDYSLETVEVTALAKDERILEIGSGIESIHPTKYMFFANGRAHNFA